MLKKYYYRLLLNRDKEKLVVEPNSWIIHANEYKTVVEECEIQSGKSKAPITLI
jgi:hypothetical protein